MRQTPGGTEPTEGETRYTYNSANQLVRVELYTAGDYTTLAEATYNGAGERVRLTTWAAGVPLTDAIIEGATARFRPVLMTSFSTVLGILPIALGLGAGAESRIPMGVAVIGGLFVGTLLTLFVVPAMMSFLTSQKARVQRFVEEG